MDSMQSPLLQGDYQQCDIKPHYCANSGPEAVGGAGQQSLPHHTSAQRNFSS